MSSLRLRSVVPTLYNPEWLLEGATAVDMIFSGIMDAHTSPNRVRKMSDTHIMTADARHVEVHISIC